MKRLKKLAIALAFILSFGIFAPAVSFVSAEPLVETFSMTEGEAISIAGFKSTGTVGNPIEFPSATIRDGGSGLTQEITVKNIYGRTMELEGNTFTPTKSGTYNVTYTLKSGEDVVFEKTLTLTVAESIEGYEMIYPTNPAEIIPTEIGRPTEGNDITVVLPKVTVEQDDKEITNAWDDVTASVTVNGVETPLEKNSEGFFTYTVTSASALGAYTFTYKYTLQTTGEFVYATKTMQVSAGYDNDTDYRVSWGSTRPSSAQLGVETTLPTVSGVDDDGNAVDVHYKVNVTYSKDGSTPVSAKETLETRDGRVYFTPNKVGSYNVTYTVTNFFGKAPTVASTSFEIRCDEDTKKPTPVVVEPYVTGDIVNGELEYTEATHKLATRATPENIMIYPIWADDNANKYVENNLTLYRTIMNSSGDTIFDETELKGDYAGKILVINPSAEIIAQMESADVADSTVLLKGYTKAQLYILGEDVVKLNDGSNYTIYYMAKDAQSNENSASYTMRVSSTEDTDAPTITFTENLPDAVMLDELISFTRPTATDVDNVDTRMLVDVTYKLYRAEVEVDLEQEENASLRDLLVYNEDTARYEITISDSTITRLEIIASTEDDAGNPAEEIKSVVVVSSGDTQATEIKEVEAGSLVGENEAVQYEPVTLPTITYTEDLPQYTKISFYIVHSATGTVYDVSLNENDGYSYELTDDGMKISGAKFTPTKSGQYDIYVTTEDAAGNITIQKFDLGVIGNMNEADMKFENLPSTISGGTLELGESASLPIPTINLEEGYSYTYRVVKVSGPDGAVLSNNMFTPSKVGTYELQYVADITDALDSTTTIRSKVYQVEVVDTTGPTINDVYYKPQYQMSEGIAIILPGAYDISGIDYTQSTVTISSSRTSRTYKLSDLANESYVTDNKIQFDQNGDILYTFPNDNLVYTITYSFTDTLGQTTERSYTVNVGDTEQPRLVVDDSLFKDTYTLSEMTNNPLVIDVAKITATDNIKLAEDWVADHLEVTVRNTTTGTTFTSTSQGSFTYNLTEAGTYEVTFIIEDAAGNEREVTRTFEVTEEGNAGMNTEEIIGTVLIVISVLVLAGVIVYFIVSKKKLEGKK